MKILVIVLVLLIPCSVLSGEIREDEYRALEQVVTNGISQLQNDSEVQIDFVLETVATAYRGSPYDKDQTAEAFRQNLKDQGTQLKNEIAGLKKEIAARSAQSPADLILSLSREQTVCFKVYRWIRTAAAISDLANAQAGRSQSESGPFTTKLSEVHETQMDVLGLSIQAIATRVLQ